MVPDTSPNSSTRASNPSESEGLSSASFEQLDQFLDSDKSDALDPTSYAGQRWKFPAAARPDGETGNDVAAPGEDTEDSQEFATVDNRAFSLGAIPLLRSIFLIGGGIVAGTVLAVGLAVSLTSDDGEEPQITNVEQAVNEVLDQDEDSNRSGPNGSGLNGSGLNDGNVVDPGDNESVQAQIPAAKIDDSESNEVDDRLISQETPKTPASTGNVEIAKSEVGATDEIASEPQAVADAAADKESVLGGDDPLDAQGDELTEFARWLQDTAVQPSVRVPASNSPVPPVVAPEEVVEYQPTRAVPQIVDVEARLLDPVEAVRFESAQLQDVLGFISQYSSIPISVETDAFEYKNLSALKRFKLGPMVKSNVKELLSKSLRKVKLDFVVDGGHVVVTSTGVKNRRSIEYRHDVEDLKPDAESMAQLVRLFVTPEAWQAEDDSVSQMSVENTGLRVTAVDLTHFRILRFLERLRLSRGLPARSKGASRFTLTRRCVRMNKLDTLVSMRMPEPSGIRQIARDLGKQAKIAILIDWQALHFSGWSPKDQVDFFCIKKPLADVLDEWLAELELTYVVVDSETLMITSPLAAVQRNEIEFYSINDLPVAQMAETLRVLEQKFPQANIIRFVDSVGGNVIVSAPQAVHRELR